jgi:oligopeptide/dipeptide ABC transporter ATP-binding protein
LQNINEEALLNIAHVYKDFVIKKKTLHAVSDVCLEIFKGEILGIVGESGCGKSTLAKMVSGLLLPTSGTITLNGIDYTKLKGKDKRNFRRNIQMVFQEPLSSFSPRMKIGTYLCEPRINYDHISKTKAFDEAKKLLEQVSLPAEFINRYPHELSGGQLQRVAIARAIAISPELLICDEATGALDVSIQKQIAQLLVKLVREQNIGCLFIGHDLALVRSVSHRIAIMYLGKIMEIIDSENLEEECIHPYTKALLNSVFDVYCNQDECVELLEGEPVSSLDMQKGCAFSSRCPLCSAKCLEAPMKMRQVGENHYTSCIMVKEF